MKWQEMAGNGTDLGIFGRRKTDGGWVEIALFGYECFQYLISELVITRY
jgi:hypothetical protein